MKVMILGSGLVGSAIALDLAQDSGFDVTIVDINSEVLDFMSNQHNISGLRADLSDKHILKDLVAQADIVVGAVPGYMGYETLKSVIEAGKNIVDISFFPEDPFRLDQLAKQRCVVAIMDCGVAPGSSNVLFGYVDSLLDKTTGFNCYVGGLPKIRHKPFEYKAVFSPIDVIEEYIRPARFIENGQLVTKPALTEPELIDFPGIGTLEAFNTDGLRTLMKTIPVPNMKEKTLRYPGHIEIMRLFRDTGFFDKTPIEVNEHQIRPVDLTAKILFPKWHLEPGDEDFTVLRVDIDGIKAGKQLRYTYMMFDQFDKQTNTTSMARTTGYTCSVMVRLVAEGKYKRVGISPPEYIGQDLACYEELMAGLAQRNIFFEEKIEEIPQSV
ncbi:saccharopine dehydrogenase NADP-binding domain-containing protein [candidate division KSB1 bacterium]|nr:saccharopine dehydrogenase NADP-binding domain-containing protein [candidate division KSB1 bacterium]